MKKNAVAEGEDDGSEDKLLTKNNTQKRQQELENDNSDDIT